jgi:hypothetical protein
MITVSFGSEFAIWQAAMDEKDAYNRPTLAAVRIDPSGLMMATDAHIAAIIPCTIEGAPEHWGGAMVPASFIKDLLKDVKSALASFAIEGEEAVFVGKKGKVSVPLVEGRFPQIDRVIPSGTGGKGVNACAIDPALFVRVAAAVGHDKNVPVAHYWEKPLGCVLVPGAKGSGAVGLLMPGCEGIANELTAEARENVTAIIGKLTGAAVKKAA